MRCDFEAHYRFEYVVDGLGVGEAVRRTCYWRAWAKNARAMAGLSDAPVSISTIQQKAEVNGFTYLRSLTDPSLEEDPHGTRCNSCGRIEAQRSGDCGLGLSLPT